MLESDDLRNGIKAYSNWPTYPQLYVKGELVGGCDIMMDMFQSGELQKILAEAGGGGVHDAGVAGHDGGGAEARLICISASSDRIGSALLGCRSL